jgi:hypothetical protein
MARRDHGAISDFLGSFCAQSMKTLPLRRDRSIRSTTSSGWVPASRAGFLTGERLGVLECHHPLQRHVDVESRRPGSLRPPGQPAAVEQLLQQDRHAADLTKLDLGSGVEIEHHLRRASGFFDSPQEGMQLDGPLVRHPHERRLVIDHAVVAQAPVPEADLGRSHPSRMSPAFCLPPPRPGHAHRKPTHRERPAREVPNQIGGHGSVVLDHVALGESGSRPQHALEVRQAERSAADHDVLALDQRRAGAHPGLNSSAISGEAWSSCSSEQDPGSRSGRHRRNRAGNRKRWSSTVS